MTPLFVLTVAQNNDSYQKKKIIQSSHDITLDQNITFLCAVSRFISSSNIFEFILIYIISHVISIQIYKLFCYFYHSL